MSVVSKFPFTNKIYFNNEEKYSSNDFKVNSVKKIGTHDGIFYCSEILACVLIKQLPQYTNAKIIRTRSPEKLGNCEIVVGVGGVFDHKNHKYDHHQPNFHETVNSLMPRKPWQIKLSSAGLVFVYYGAEVIARLLNLDKKDVIVDLIFDKIYEKFILEVDSLENGVEPFEEDISEMTISAKVRNFNPGCNDKVNDRVFSEKFSKAYEFVESEFKKQVISFSQNLFSINSEDGNNSL